MGWKNWPYWLRGGIIVLVFEIILIGLVLLLQKLIPPISDIEGVVMVLAFPLYLSFILGAIAFGLMDCQICKMPTDCFNPSYCNWIPTIIMILTFPIFSFLIGALVGWIVG
jgi:hypothetical protein